MQTPAETQTNPLAGQVVLITGAGRGWGAELARAFAGQGARVAANDISPLNVEACAAEIEQTGGQVRVFLAEIASKLAVQSLLHEILDTWGRIDILINHAQVRPRHPLLELDEWDWRRVLDVNLSGAFLLTQSVAREMRVAGGGTILNLARLEGPGAFVASKMGLIGLTQAAAGEFGAYNIRINAICPAANALPGLDPLPAGLPAATGVVDLALYLCHPAAAGISGQVIAVGDGR